MNILADRVRIDPRYYVTVSAALAVCLFSAYAMPLFGEHADMVVDTAASVASNNNDAAGSKGGWFVTKSNNFEIYSEDTVNLQSVSRKLGRRGLFVGGVYGPNPTGAPPQKMAYMLDRLLKRAEEILGMYPDLSTVKIKIFKDREELNREYFKMFGAKTDFKSFYIHPLETIYTCEEDISDSVIAHEMGHAIVDHYFSTVPPPKVAELLAQYVDKNLED